MKFAIMGLLLTWTAAQSATPTVDEIIARHIHATGGRVAWENARAQTRKGMALPDAGNFPLESAATLSGKWLFTIRLPNGRTMRHGFDGAEAWEERGTAARMDRDSALDEALIYDPFWLLRARETFPKMTLRGKEKNGDGEVYVIEAIPAQGRTRVLFFDVASGLLLRAGKTMYADYRDAGGLKAPYLVRYGFQTFHFMEIRHDEAVDEGRFRMPEIPPPPAPAPAADLPGADELVKKYLAAIGGSQAVSKISTQVRTGMMNAGPETFRLETVAKAPGKWLLRLYTGGSSPEKEGYSGSVAWSESADVVKDMNPRELPELETFLNFQLPLKLEAICASMAVRRKEKLGAREVYVVEAAPPEGARRTLAFDVKTGLLVRADTVLFDDYREVAGVKVPFRVRLKNGELNVEFSETRHDEPAPDSVFERPAPGAAFEKNFEGLEDRQALAVLRRVIGQGVSPSDGRMMYDMIVEKGYRRALDLGTAEGYAAMWFGLAMKRTGGGAITIEIDPEVADKARANLKAAGLDAEVDSRINDALLEIPALKGDFDFVFMDTGAPLNQRFFDLLRTRIRSGGAILAHNASSFATQQPEFLNAIQGDASFETRILQTARGGILVSVKKK